MIFNPGKRHGLPCWRVSGPADWPMSFSPTNWTMKSSYFLTKVLRNCCDGPRWRQPKISHIWLPPPLWPQYGGRSQYGGGIFAEVKIINSNSQNSQSPTHKIQLIKSNSWSPTHEVELSRSNSLKIELTKLSSQSPTHKIQLTKSNSCSPTHAAELTKSNYRGPT